MELSAAPPGQDVRALQIIGAPSMVHLAQMILDLRVAPATALYDPSNQHSQPYGMSIYVPETSVGRVVGKAGCNLTECRKTFGVHLNLRRDGQDIVMGTENRKVRLFEIRAADKGQLENAAEMLVQKVLEARVEELKRRGAEEFLAEAAG